MIPRSLAALAVALAAAACGSAPADSTARHGPGLAGHGAMAGMCPMEVPGTTVVAVDTADGIALDFSTTGDAAELRRRVAHRAAVHAEMPCSGKAAPAGGGLGRNRPPATSVTVTEFDDGARLAFVAEHPDDTRAVREFVRRRAAEMQSGTCPGRRAP